jgi:hypothetical protein
MIVPLFGLLPASYYRILIIGFLLVALLIGLFVRATRNRRAISEKDRRAGLGCLSVLFGPLVGLFLAWLANRLGAVYPSDVGHTYYVFGVIGGLAGLLAGVVFAVTGLFDAGNFKETPVLTKPVGIGDEL